MHESAAFSPLWSCLGKGTQCDALPFSSNSNFEEGAGINTNKKFSVFLLESQRQTHRKMVGVLGTFETMVNLCRWLCSYLGLAGLPSVQRTFVLLREGCTSDSLFPQRKDIRVCRQLGLWAGSLEGRQIGRLHAIAWHTRVVTHDFLGLPTGPGGNLASATQH